MCGISGVYRFNEKKPDSQLIRKMVSSLRHRGPDDEGYFADHRVSIGHCRLKIIDTSDSGHQPMSNEDGTVWIVYNGECYNHQILRKELLQKGHIFKSTSDTEVLIHLYEEEGPDFIERIRGMFAFAIWDSRKCRFILARDRLGIKPLYYTIHQDGLFFASEMKALMFVPGISRNLNWKALGCFFHFLSIPDPDAIFEGIEKLPAGSFLCVQKNTLKKVKYWDIHPELSVNDNDPGKVMEQLSAEMDTIIQQHLISDAPIGATLSGGLDSSAICALAARKKTSPLNTYCVSFKGHEEYDESAYARQVAEYLGTRHIESDLPSIEPELLEKIVWHADEPFAISSALGVFQVAALASKEVKVLLAGDGSDELFCGYLFRHLPGESDASPGSIDYATRLCYFSPDILAELLKPEVIDLMGSSWKESILPHYRISGGSDEMNRRLYTEVKTTLVSEMLTKVDRMTMAYGVEARVPFLDHHMVELAFKIPGHLKFYDNQGKYILKRCMENYLPESITQRPKHGFNVPFLKYLSERCREFLLDILNESTLQRRGIYQKKAICKFLDSIQKSDFEVPFMSDLQIFSVIALEIWFRMFMDNSSGYEKF